MKSTRIMPEKKLRTKRKSIEPSIFSEKKMKTDVYAVDRNLPVLKCGTVFVYCHKCHFSFSFSEEMVRLFDFLFVLRFRRFRFIKK